ncbi:RNA-directed DNA polymerase, eukaryota, reverse transcriptase zinc-binding domain protein [Tanacetum coccineum]|uniref:RNA-directed DNA polymerase, eukaryota, reverse transcriptase zinc-binding domain protein n=1 Tax=Tanacetum coccineum TaxID=301880 RepID=A0ABQ4ZRM3_9ASTR
MSRTITAQMCKKSFAEELSKVNGTTYHNNSYAGAVKQKGLYNGVDGDNKPFLVLDDSCISQGGFSLSLMGKVKDFGLLSNLKMILAKEGFVNLTLKYMGVHGKIHWVRAKEVTGWEPDFIEDEEVEEGSDEDIATVDSEKEIRNLKSNCNSEGDSDCEEVPDTVFDQDHDRSKQEYPLGFTSGENVKVISDFVDNLVREESASNHKAYNEKSILEVKNSKTKSLSKEEDIESGCSDSIQGEWIPNAKKCLITFVYAPQEVFKKMLWNYLDHVIDNWIGETIIMGDFNEVRSKDKRYGSLFNAYSVAAFNSFISSRGLGFDKLVEESWIDLTISDSNAILKFMKKLKCLKEKNRLWTKEKKESSKSQKSKLKGMLSDIDVLIDNECVDQELLNKRSHVMHSLHDLEKLESLEIDQKVNRWCVD